MNASAASLAGLLALGGITVGPAGGQGAVEIEPSWTRVHDDSYTGPGGIGPSAARGERLVSVLGILRGRSRVRGARLSTGAVLWEVDFPGEDPLVEAEAVVITPDGRDVFVLAATSARKDAPDVSEMTLFRFDPDTGEGEIADRYTQAADAQMRPVEMAVSPDGFFLGYCGNAKIETFKTFYVSTLIVRDLRESRRAWQKSFGSVQSDVSITAQGLVMGEGTVAFTASEFPTSLPTVFSFERRTGNERWSASLPPLREIEMALAPDESSLVVGGDRHNVGPRGTYALSNANGAVLWDDAGEASEVEFHPSGDLLFRATDEDLGDPRVTAFDPLDGSIEWEDAVDLEGGHSLLALAPSADGDSLIAVGTTGMGSIFLEGDIATLAYEARTGVRRWVRRFDHLGLPEVAHCASLTDSGFVSITGVAGVPSPVGSGLSFLALSLAYDAATGTELWTRVAPVELDATDVAYAVAVAYDGSAVYSASQSLAGSGYTDRVLAHDSVTGRVLWETVFPDAGAYRNQAVVVSPRGDGLFVQLASVGNDHIVGLDPRTGEVRWERSLPYTQGFGPPQEQLVLSNDAETVYALHRWQVGANPTVYDTNLTALDARTGADRWDRVLGEGDGARVALSHDGRLVYACVREESFGNTTGNACLVALAVSDGAEQWRHDFASASFHRPFFDVDPTGARIFVAGMLSAAPTGARLSALDASDGTQLWSIVEPAARKFGMRVSADGKRVYRCYGSLAPGTLQSYSALDALTGQELWSRTGPESFVEFEEAQGGSVLVALGATTDASSRPLDVSLRAFDSVSGDPLWSSDFDGLGHGGDSPRAVEAGPHERRLFVVGATDGIETSTGAFVQAYDAPMLAASEQDVSLSAGGVRPFLLHTGEAGAGYVLLGGMGESGPTQVFAGDEVLSLPFAPDAYTWSTLEAAPPVFRGFRGRLDGAGRANAELCVPALSDPSLAGTVLHHAAVVLRENGQPLLVTERRSLRLVP